MKNNRYKLAILILFTYIFPYTSIAQLEFSNWIVGHNTMMHINDDGSTKLETYNGFRVDNKYYKQLLSDNKGIPIIQIGYEKSNKYIFNSYLKITFNSVSGEKLYPEMYISDSPIPFMLKSPNDKYTYVIYSTCSQLYETTQLEFKTQIRCFCKNNSDNTDKGKDFVLCEFRDIDHGNALEYYPYFDGFSHSDGESVWIIVPNVCYKNDSLTVIKLYGDEIREKKTCIFT